jgi:hypothetical protein
VRPELVHRLDEMIEHPVVMEGRGREAQPLPSAKSDN